MDFSKQHHVQQDPDHLNIHWDSLTICQYNCSYCYARNEYGDKWGKLMSKENIDKVIYAFSQSTLSFNLGLLGGEPTLHPHFEYILDKVTGLDNNNRVYVTTNGLKDISKFKNNNKVAWLFSYHPADITDVDLFLKNIQYCLDNGIQVKVNAMIHHDKRLWQQIKDMIILLLDMKVKVHPHFLYTNWDMKLFKYRPELWEFFSFLEDFPKELVYDDQLYNDFQIYRDGMTNFKGWRCWNNNYEVDVYGNVAKFCMGKREGDSLLTNPTYFKQINKTLPMICPHSQCNCDGLLKQYKEK